MLQLHCKTGRTVHHKPNPQQHRAPHRQCINITSGSSHQHNQFTGRRCTHCMCSQGSHQATMQEWPSQPGTTTTLLMPPQTSTTSGSRGRVMWQQCLLLAASAIAAAPGLLLLDTAEQCELALMRLRHPAATHQTYQDSQRSRSRYSMRPLLPLWPPVLPMVLAVAPAGLLLLPACRQVGLQAPILLLCGSLVLQAYLNLQLVVCARVHGSPAAAQAAPTWCTETASSNAGLAGAAAQADPTPAAPAAGGRSTQHDSGQNNTQRSWPTAAAGSLFAGLQVAGDALRCVCACCMAWLYAHAAAGSSGSAAAIWHGIQQCCTNAPSTAHCIAAASAVAGVVQQSLPALLQGLAVVAVCCGSGAVYGLSLLSRWHLVPMQVLHRNLA